MIWIFPVAGLDERGFRVARAKAGDDLALELDTAGEPAAEHRRNRQRLARPDHVPLGPDRALLSRVSAKRRYLRDVVTSGHGLMLRV